ncbi:MAG: type II toxin-antitoxin system HicB family antitoxin [Bacteroidetes bacterium]|nr:type II toxin-antitoxin system HicB family antitoxin [Bacteroidota bacterium]
MIIKNYLETAIKKAEYKKLKDGTWFGEIPSLKGIWANGNSVEECRNELLEVLEEWLLLKIKDNDTIPIISGVNISFRKLAG